MKRTRLKTNPKKLREWHDRSRRENPLRSGKGPERRTPIKKRNRKRKAKEWTRAYGSPERVAWVGQQPSVVSGRRPCENAHVPDPEGPSGMGRKADARWIVPLTAAEHEELHREGPETFQRTHDIDLQAEARKIDARWKRSPENPENG